MSYTHILDIYLLVNLLHESQKQVHLHCRQIVKYSLYSPISWCQNVIDYVLMSYYVTFGFILGSIYK